MTKQTKIILSACFYMAGIIIPFLNGLFFLSFILFCLILAFAIKRKFSIKETVLFVAFLTFGLINSFCHINHYDGLSPYSDNMATIKAEVLTIPSNNDETKTGFFAKVNEVSIDGDKFEQIKAKTMVTIIDEKSKLKNIKIGDTLKLSGLVKAPTTAKNPSQFDYSKYLQLKNTFTLFYVQEDWEILSGSHTVWGKFLSKLNTKRTEIIDIHKQNIASPMIEILGGIIFGDDAVNPDTETKTKFTNSGIIHILAASGMNVTLIFGIWFFFARTLKMNYRFSITMGILLILFYTCMTGFGPPIIRAFLMLTLILIGKLIDRSTPTLALLFLVAFLMLTYNPLMIFDIGFQLSFVVTFALILTAPLLVLNTKSKLMNYTFGACMIPLIAQIFAAPLQLLYFGTFTLYSVFANIAIIPVLSIVSFIGFISSIIALIPVFAQKICYIADLILNPLLVYIVKVADFFANLPFAIVYLKKPTILQVIIYFVIVILFICTIRFIKEKKKFFISLSILCILFLTSVIPLGNNNAEVIVFSVGNADSILIKSPKNQYFLIDSGKLPYQEQKSQAKNIIVKYLYDKGVMKLNSYIITHFDADHAGGSIDILNNLKVENLYMSEVSEDTQLSNSIKTYLIENNIKAIDADNVQTIYEEADFKLTLIKPVGENIKTENQKSLIIHCACNDKNILFMGDGDVVSYDVIPKEFKNNVSYIKVGHHGAKNTISDEMLLNTSEFIISTGKNPYNHPSPDTLEKLKNNKFYRTDYFNAIKITIGEKPFVSFFSPLERKFIKQ